MHYQHALLPQIHVGAYLRFFLGGGGLGKSREAVAYFLRTGHTPMNLLYASNIECRQCWDVYGVVTLHSDRVTTVPLPSLYRYRLRRPREARTKPSEHRDTGNTAVFVLTDLHNSSL